MRNRKDFPNEQSSPTTKVKQRTKKDSITIEGVIEIREGAFIKGQHAFTKAGNDTIKLKVTVSSSDWPRLWSYCLNYPSEFVRQFWSSLIYPAMKELETKKGARRRYKESKHFVNWLKDDASFLYAFFNYWCKNPVEEWPDYLQRLLNNIKGDERYSTYVFGKATGGFFKERAGTNRP